MILRAGAIPVCRSVEVCLDTTIARTNRRIYRPRRRQQTCAFRFVARTSGARSFGWGRASFERENGCIIGTRRCFTCPIHEECNVFPCLGGRRNTGAVCAEGRRHAGVINAGIAAISASVIEVLIAPIGENSPRFVPIGRAILGQGTKTAVDGDAVIAVGWKQTAVGEATLRGKSRTDKRTNHDGT